MSIIRKSEKVFLIACVIPIALYSLLFLLRWFGIYTKAFNIPGFLVVGIAIPWSMYAAQYAAEINSTVGHQVGSFIRILVVTIGFAMNITMLFLAFIFAQIKFRNWRIPK